ncbi:MAG TPA: alpha/beta hydrolase [Stellaceae bacterium]|nr:alpha/beta hydrolase [Stellaceae bacterium]
MKPFAIAFAAALLAATLAAGPTMAMSQQTADVEAQIRALGKRWDGEVNQKSKQLYMPLLAKVPRKDIAVTKDLAYGADAQQKLDIYVRGTTGRGRPVVVYAHGGGLVRGDKNEPGTDGLIYSNVPVYFARHGMVGVNMNYRLVPNTTYPGAGADVAGAVTWLRTNIAKYGGDPNAIFVLGTSGGGTALATYLYEPKVQGANGPEIAGAILLSGVIELDKQGPRERDTRGYYGDDKSIWASLDPYNKIDSYTGKRVPTFIINAELDPTEIELAGGMRHFAKLCERDKACPRYYQAQNMNHITTSLSLGTDDDSLGAELRDFVRRTMAVHVAPKTAQKM